MGWDKKRIMVVDDEEMIQRSLRAYLEDEGFEVVAVKTGESGLEILDEGGADVAIVDIRLPGMDGNAFIEKAHAISPETGFIIYTGSVDYSPPHGIKVLGVHKTQVFKKPLNDMAVLVEAVRGQMGRRSKS